MMPLLHEPAWKFNSDYSKTRFLYKMKQLNLRTSKLPLHPFVCGKLSSYSFTPLPNQPTTFHLSSDTLIKHISDYPVSGTVLEAGNKILNNTVFLPQWKVIYIQTKNVSSTCDLILLLAQQCQIIYSSHQQSILLVN